MLEVFEPEALNYFTFFRPILLTLSASRNPILTDLPLSGFLDSLLCILIAPTPGLAFSLLMSRTLAAMSSFSSGRAYLSLNFLPPLSLRLIPTLMGLTNPGRALRRSYQLLISLKLLTLSGIPPFSINSFRLASLLALLVGLVFLF